MRNSWVIIKRELNAYFSTPLAYVFIVIFLALSGALTFFMGAFLDRGQADLNSFFSFHPWIYLLIIQHYLLLAFRIFKNISIA